MNKEQTENKNLTQTSTDNTTKVHIRLDEPKKSVSFRCNVDLWNAFKSETRRKKLSICHVLEPMIFGWLEGEVHLSNTIRPLIIENMNVERAVKRVRRYAVEEETEEVSKEFCFYCLKSRRRVAAVGLLRYDKTGEVYALCSYHANMLLESGVWSHV
jgi:hypothetical protein